MSDEALAAVLARTSHVLLDFDGPVCSVFSNFSPAEVAHELRTRLALVDAPETNEPFEILSYVAREKPADAVRAEAELALLETSAAGTAAPTSGAAAALRHFKESGRPVVIVSNNSTAAVHAYLVRHSLTHLVAGVTSRTDPDPHLLKPAPFLLHNGARLLNAEISSCLMIGDSITDIQAAHAAGAAVLGYANKPGKREKFERVKPDAIIEDMAELLGV